ncbi:hypothetical protein Sango_2632400 [Sesamum angolense]|uniref:Uncharacterized protein n=1 Tax=Sesamum angolense TaxID=2727404 RepID=A0AAE2BGQ3_9LAMI|nr:hypothetical protein Sango_2632400 [Sesamum angolense]
MGWYRRSPRLISDALRTYTSKIVVPGNPIQESISRTNFFRRSLQPNFSRPFLKFHNKFSRIFCIMGSSKFNGKALFMMGRRGFTMSTDSEFSRGWAVSEPKNVLVVVLVGNYEKELGESQFKQIKAQFKGKILPPLHPDSIRVQSIAQDIIDALQKGLRKDRCGVISGTLLKVLVFLMRLMHMRQ